MLGAMHHRKDKGGCRALGRGELGVSQIVSKDLIEEVVLGLEGQLRFLQAKEAVGEGLKLEMCTGQINLVQTTCASAKLGGPLSKENGGNTFKQS